MAVAYLCATDIAAELHIPRSTARLYLRGSTWWVYLRGGQRVSTKCGDVEAAREAARRLEFNTATAQHLEHVPAGATRGKLDMRFMHLPDGEGVYFLHAFTVGLVKIGCARQLRLRVQGLALANAAPLRCIGWTPGYKPEEAALHRACAAHRAHGEWFHDHPDVMARLTPVTP